MAADSSSALDLPLPEAISSAHPLCLLCKQTSNWLWLKKANFQSDSCECIASHTYSIAGLPRVLINIWSLLPTVTWKHAALNTWCRWKVLYFVEGFMPTQLCVFTLPERGAQLCLLLFLFTLLHPLGFLHPALVLQCIAPAFLQQKPYSLKLFVIVNVSISLAEKTTFETPQQDLKYRWSSPAMIVSAFVNIFFLINSCESFRKLSSTSNN